MVKIFMRYKKSNTVCAYASKQDHLIECNFKTCWMSEHKTYLLRKYYNWKSIQAHIGKEGDGQYRGHGGYNFSQKNEAILNFCMAFDIAIASTQFEKKRRRRPI